MRVHGLRRAGRASHVLQNAGLWLVFVTLIAAAAHPARADAARGSQLARQWCVNCHVIGDNPTGAVPQGPPNFRTIARTMPVDQLRAFLSHPHGAMPDLSLTRAEIDDLIGYIEGLR